MATRLRGTLVDGLNKPIVNATVALLAKGNSLLVLSGSEAIFKTSATGTYDITVQTGYYKVIIGPQGSEPYKAGEIAIYADSKEGTLNNYLTSWAPEELTPEVIAQVKDLVAQAETAKNASAASATKSEQERVKAETAAQNAVNTANGMKASIGLTTAPRHVPDITVEPTAFLGFIRIVRSTTVGYPDIASSENVLAGFVTAMDGTPGYVGVFVGDFTGTVYTYRWTKNVGAVWWKQVNYSTVNRYSQLNAETNFTNQLGNAKVLIDNNKVWGAYDNDNKRYIPLAIAQGGTGAVNVNDALENFGLGRNSAPRFKHLDLDNASNSTQAASGILNGYLRDSSGVQRTKHRLYSEIKSDGKAWLTMQIYSDESTQKTLGYNIDGDFQIVRNFIGQSLQLSDLTTTHKNLQIDRFKQLSSGTRVYGGPADERYFEVHTGAWGVYNVTENKWIPLAISQGGTGAVTVADAKKNLLIPDGGLDTATRVDKPAGAEDNKYYPIIISQPSGYDGSYLTEIEMTTPSRSASQSPNCNILRAWVRSAGWGDKGTVGFANFFAYDSKEVAILCIRGTTKGQYPHNAVYVKGDAFPVYIRKTVGSRITVPTADWSADASASDKCIYKWGITGDQDGVGDEYGCRNILDFVKGLNGFYCNDYFRDAGGNAYLKDGMNYGGDIKLQVRKLEINGNLTAGNAITAFGPTVANNTFVSQLTNADASQALHQSEFRAGESGGQIVVRDMTSSANHKFFNFNLDGSFSPPNGLLSSTGVDWNSQINTVNKFYGIAGQVNSAENNVVYGGIHVGFSGNYAFQLAGRNNKASFRTFEAGTPGPWMRLITDQYADFKVPIFANKNGEAITIKSTVADNSESGYIAGRNNANARLWYIGKSGPQETVVIRNDMNGNQILLRDGAGDISLDTKDGNKVVYANASNFRLVNSNGKYTRLVTSGTSTHAISMDNWGTTTRPTVFECKYEDPSTSANVSWIFYGQVNTDGSRVFQVNGSVNCVTLNQSSDRDLKDNIKPIKDATNALRKMNGYTYTLKEDGLPYAGVIAQEVMEALPEAVSSFTKHEYMEGQDEDGNDTRYDFGKRYLSVDYSAVTGLLVQVCREADDRISKLETEVEELKKLVATLVNKEPLP
ncbi:lateral tail fiber protein [Escherichia phage WildeMaa]|nr:lateral tail fiber protein [Escherichia phage WildeMaa]